jgi:hypothetical protein
MDSNTVINEVKKYLNKKFPLSLKDPTHCDKASRLLYDVYRYFIVSPKARWLLGEIETELPIELGYEEAITLYYRKHPNRFPHAWVEINGNIIDLARTPYEKFGIKSYKKKKWKGYKPDFINTEWYREMKAELIDIIERKENK